MGYERELASFTDRGRDSRESRLWWWGNTSQLWMLRYYLVLGFELNRLKRHRFPGPDTGLLDLVGPREGLSLCDFNTSIGF